MAVVAVMTLTVVLPAQIVCIHGKGYIDIKMATQHSMVEVKVCDGQRETSYM